jgi:hypothetical protein
MGLEKEIRTLINYQMLVETNHERYDEISTHCHGDLLQLTPVLEAADWNPTELSKEPLGSQVFLAYLIWRRNGTQSNDITDQKHLPVEETPSLLLGGELRIHHVYLCHLQLTFCRSNLLVVYWERLSRLVEMSPWALAKKNKFLG